MSSLAIGLPVQSLFSDSATMGSNAVGAMVCTDHPALPMGLKASKKEPVIFATLFPGSKLPPDNTLIPPSAIILKAFGRTCSPSGIGTVM